MKPKFTLIINASPHKKSQTEGFCKVFEKNLKTPFQRVNLSEYNLPYSDGTYKLHRGDCARLRKLVLGCSGVFIATPTYWYNVPAKLKSFIELLTPIDSKLENKERLLALAVHAPHGGEIGVFNAIVAPLNMMGFSLIGTGYAWYSGGRYDTNWWKVEVEHMAERFNKGYQNHTKD